MRRKIVEVVIIAALALALAACFLSQWGSVHCYYIYEEHTVGGTYCTDK